MKKKKPLHGVHSPAPSRAKEGRKNKRNASPYILGMFQMLIMYMLMVNASWENPAFVFPGRKEE